MSLQTIGSLLDVILGPVQTFEMAITIKDIAKEAGVHYSTVSLALRNDPRISDHTRKKIQNLANEMGYVTDATMKALCAYREANRPHPVRSGLAYLTDKSLDDPFGRMVYDVARDQASHLGYNLIYYNLSEEGMTLKRLRSIWKHSGLKGVLIGTFENPGSILDDD
ncbi:MAG: LacI family DNA-binding transcriptional regulator, partial [Puniceicoccales bacterium]